MYYDLIVGYGMFRSQRLRLVISFLTCREVQGVLLSDRYCDRVTDLEPSPRPIQIIDPIA